MKELLVGIFTGTVNIMNHSKINIMRTIKLKNKKSFKYNVITYKNVGSTNKIEFSYHVGIFDIEIIKNRYKNGICNLYYEIK